MTFQDRYARLKMLSDKQYILSGENFGQPITCARAVTSDQAPPGDRSVLASSPWRVFTRHWCQEAASYHQTLLSQQSGSIAAQVAMNRFHPQQHQAVPPPQPVAAGGSC